MVPTVPYISDAATYSPESCIFGQLINIGSVLCKFQSNRTLGESVSENSNLELEWRMTHVLIILRFLLLLLLSIPLLRVV